jgi:DNA polymerase III epsilon subunit-like protein
LEENGILIEQAEEKVDNFLKDANDLMVVSHGLKNDRMTLENNGIDLYTTDEKTIYPYCTYNAAKRILKRDKKLNLKEVAMEAGLFLSNSHNAFDDVVAGIAVFSLLCKLDSEVKNEKIL